MRVPQLVRNCFLAVLFQCIFFVSAKLSSANDTYTMNDNKRIPVIGLGVYRVKPGMTTYNTVLAALKLGYRMIDTAAFYENEEDVGRAIRDSGLNRSEIFVTTKLKDTDHGFENAIRAGQKSNATLGIGYIDLYLIHSPGVFQPGKIVETWDAFSQLKEQGVTRSIGVSNFGVAHLEALKKHRREIPTVNQFELHPMVMKERADVVDFCRSNNIIVQPYGSVLSGHQDLLQKFNGMAEKRNKTNAQLLLRWALEQNFQVIPKSVHRERLEENLAVFDFALSAEEISDMNSLSSGRLKDYWDPLAIPVDEGRTDLLDHPRGSRVVKKSGGNLQKSISAVEMQGVDRNVRVVVDAAARIIPAKQDT